MYYALFIVTLLTSTIAGPDLPSNVTDQTNTYVVSMPGHVTTRTTV